MKFYMQTSSRFLSFFVVFCLLPVSVNATDKKEMEYADLQQRIVKWHETLLLNDNFTVEHITEFEVKALTEKVVKQLKKRQFSYSTGIEQFEVLEAYTKKADGTRVDVPKDNYQVNVNKGNRDGGPIFSDRTRVTVVFPDLEVNDSIVVKSKKIETEPMFPGHFSARRMFWSQSAYDDVNVVINLPKDLKFKHEVVGMKETINSENGRKLITLKYKNAKPLKNDRQNFSVWVAGSEPGFYISTFKDYEAVAKAYAERALPKAVPTQRVEELAKKIVGKETDKKAKARLLYDWVVTNISYAGNCIGVGAVVPHDIDFILDNKMGDCKDHATLLQAFYTAVGIESVQALVNSGSSYSLPNIPMVSSVNHVMTYLPEWDMFVDSTSSDMPFDLLSFSVSDKPVLLVENYRANMRTPPSQPGVNRQEVDSVMKVQSDGSVTGTLEVKLKGIPAVGARSSWRHVSEAKEKEWIEGMFSSQNKIGSGTMKKDDPVPLLSEFNYAFEFNKPEFLPSKGAGGFYISPVMNTPASIFSFLSYSNEEIDGYDVSCSNGHSIERLLYEFPKGMKILAKPDNFEINENHIHFRASYDLEDNKLSVVREINDETPGNVCSAELLNAQRLTLIKIAENLNSQLVYKN